MFGSVENTAKPQGKLWHILDALQGHAVTCWGEGSPGGSSPGPRLGFGAHVGPLAQPQRGAAGWNITDGRFGLPLHRCLVSCLLT